jgi:twitching motility protein PilT
MTAQLAARVLYRENSSTMSSQPESTIPMTDLPQHESLDALLSIAMQSNASDIILVAGTPATFRVNGALRTNPGPVLSESDIQSILVPLLTPTQTQQLQTHKCLDLCLVNEGVGRIRANLHFQRGTLAAAIRLLPAEIPTFKSLNLPEQLSALAERRQGPHSPHRRHRLR